MQHQRAVDISMSYTLLFMWKWNSRLLQQ